MKRSVLQSMGLALALTFAPQVAAAQMVGGDLVILNNGGRLRGVVSEYDPGVRVVIQLPDGTSRTVAAADIASVTFADAQPSLPTPEPDVPEPSRQAPAASVPTVPVAPSASTAEASNVVRWTVPRVYEARRLVRWTNSARKNPCLKHESPTLREGE